MIFLRKKHTRQFIYLFEFAKFTPDFVTKMKHLKATKRKIAVSKCYKRVTNAFIAIFYYIFT